MLTTIRIAAFTAGAFFGTFAVLAFCQASFPACVAFACVAGFASLVNEIAEGWR